MPKQGFLVDVDNLQFLVDEVKTGEIIHLPPNLMKPLAQGLATNPNFMYAAASGVPISYDYGGQFQQRQTLLAVEVVRFEPNPDIIKCEPQFNLNRYIFGLSTANDRAYGIDVTTWQSNPITAQVGNHWDEIKNYVDGHFGSANCGKF